VAWLTGQTSSGKRRIRRRGSGFSRSSFSPDERSTGTFTVPAGMTAVTFDLFGAERENTPGFITRPPTPRRPVGLEPVGKCCWWCSLGVTAGSDLVTVACRAGRESGLLVMEE
jgi:hypothetical protein